MQKIAKLTHACKQTVAGLLFIFVDHGAGIRRATYLCLDCAKNVDKNWNIHVTVSFIIHVNFYHAWAEHYPVTLSSMPQYTRIRRMRSMSMCPSLNYGSVQQRGVILWGRRI